MTSRGMGPMTRTIDTVAGWRHTKGAEQVLGSGSAVDNPFVPIDVAEANDRAERANTQAP